VPQLDLFTLGHGGPHSGRLIDLDRNAQVLFRVNRPGFTGGQNSRRIARYGTDIKEEYREAVFT
jgi:hypothetical protein